MKNKNAIIYSTIMILGGIFFLLFFLFFYPYHLYHREQTSIFILSMSVLTDYLSQPAVLSCIIGDYLTQFFYYQGVGPLIISVILIVLAWVYYCLLYRFSPKWVLIISAILTLWEFGKLCNLYYPLSATLSLMGGALIALFFIRSNIKSNKVIILLALVSIVTSYWLFGIGAWVTLIFIIPYVSWYIILFLVIEIFSLSIVAKRIYAMRWNEVFVYPSTALFGKPNLERERILKYDCEYYFNRINRLKYEKNVPNGILPIYYTHLIEARQQNLPSILLTRTKCGINGLFIPVVSTSTPQSIYAANEVWFELGDMTLAEHATILGMIFSPRSKGSRALKRLAEINLINQDDEAAMKYLRILQNTSVYNGWATERMPGQQSDKIKQWLTAKRRLLPQKDTIRSGTDIQLSLCNLLDANCNNRLALDYLLCYDLLIKDIESFANHIDKYANGYPYHRLYQEAYLIYLAGQKEPLTRNEEMRIAPDVIDDFYQYTELYHSNGDNIEQLKLQFAKTYWFYFHFSH